MLHNDWVSWWLETGFGKKGHIPWDAKHQSSTWDAFHQVTHSSDGAAKVMCKRCGQILEHPNFARITKDGNKQRQGTSTMKNHLISAGCVRASLGERSNITRFLQPKNMPIADGFSQEKWERELLTLLTVARLPFRLIEHPTFHRLVQMAQSAPKIPEIPSAKTIRRRLQSSVQQQQQQEDILRTLPDDTKISIALDCWTSPFTQAFMAITGYFIDKDWQYREVLLGFEPLHGSHSGANLSSILLDILLKHKIEDRVFAITTDNASNNQTLVDTLQQAISEDTTLIRVPCLAHVIQLSLNELLGHIKACPQNESTETQWTEQRSQSARANITKEDIANTLSNIRNLAIYVNASPQRRETFYNLQGETTKPMPLQDVKTRWNSTFLMLRRAKRLRSFFQPFCDEYERPDMVLDDEEWRQVDYLLFITQPFFDFTVELSKTRDATTYHVFLIYNKLFEHLELSITQLTRKRTTWKRQMLQALQAARKKLDEYFSETDNVRGHLYAITTMLAPANKFQFFQTDDWDDRWRTTYRKSLENHLIVYKDRLAQQPTSPLSLSSGGGISRLDSMVKPKRPRCEVASDELSQYLDSDISPLVFWRENTHRFPTLAALAQDVLSVPATGAGVERLFNTARDICHYSRGRLSATTIQELMMFLCTSKFEIAEEQAEFLQEFFTRDEIEASKEEKESTPNTVSVDPISDTEEEQTHEEGEKEIQGGGDIEVVINHDDDPPLPSNQEESTQIRASPNF
ncbi:hypothetical protein PENANT_c110G10938 [Penicillium antarcticum]|uniref:BED-type domain-containing protein n=1 Tax=Penicillium antarcticum TaxID=416450 RepID=A0A1V6PL55_9EURO|nr:hypothetical protein PENANT_c110G10938 [Penicillium antarcticum]